MIVDLLHLFLLSLFISLVTFGGGSQALYYQYGVVSNHWLTRNDLSAVLAWGYATPGPAVFSTSAFIGYHLGGIFGAIVGAVGIFVLPFLSSVIAARYLTRLLRNRHAAYFVRGVGLAAAGLVAATAFGVVSYKHIALWQVVILLASLVISLKWKLNPLFILLGGGVIGVLLTV